jgi:hypothetical protein
MKDLIEKLEDLATFFTLAASKTAEEQYKESRLDSSGRLAAFYEGKNNAFETAFKKIDKIIKEVKA